MSIDIKKIEEDVLDFWKKHHVFEKSLKQREDAKPFIFYEGPPSANGKPHIGHFVTRIFKDAFVRYRAMRGFFVRRKAGWDTHGLPIEVQVEKELGFKTKHDIEKYGIAEFNKKAKELVWKYKDEWERFSRRIGFWLDTEHPYITYETPYMETLWWIIKQINKKKLLYKDFRVAPYCARCGTSLSSHEVSQGYRTITDKSVIVKFEIQNKFPISNSKLKKGSKIYLLAWTTTPWTLPGNVALAVNEKIIYAIFKIREEYYVAAEDLLSSVSGGEEYEIVGKISGKDLVGIAYNPLFDIKELQSESSYKVYAADFVTTGEGTGIVHTAVMYGEDDFNLGTKINLPKIHTVSEEGKFRKIVGPEFAGLYVKDLETEKKIIALLKKRNLLMREENYTHEYPFCWRCHEPLLYYALDSWFVAIQKIKKDLLKNNQKIHWHPAHLKEGRFGEWLREIKDWNFSRSRFWGTPLPIWECQTGKSRIQNPKSKGGNCENMLVIDSLDGLEKRRATEPNIFYALRHAESENNVQQTISSSLEHDNSHITEKGRKEAAKAARKLREQGKIDLIFSSPFLRTRETAEIIGHELGVSVIIDNRLGEFQHNSTCEGKTHHVCLKKDAGLMIDKLDFKYGDGETWLDMRKRVFPVLRELDEKYSGKRILLVSHAGPIVLLEAIVRATSDKDLLRVLNYEFGVLDESKRGKDFPKNGEVRLLPLKNWPYDGEGYVDLHRPYIDRILLKCDQCSGLMKRVEGVVDVWFDSGAMPFAQEHFPFSCIKEKNAEQIMQNHQALIKNCIPFPADFISEGVDQTRGWFYTLLAVSTLLETGPAYKNVLSLGHVLDERGQKMAKSKGNVIHPQDVIKNFGADPIRWHLYSMNQAGDAKRFSIDGIREVTRNLVFTILNSVRFYELYAPDKKTAKQASDEPLPLDQWIRSRMQTVLKETTGALENYDATRATRILQSFIRDEVSNWWIRRSREDFQSRGKYLASKARLFREILLYLTKMIAPFMPFIAEHVYQRIRLPEDPLSVHFADWPIADGKLINASLEKDMAIARALVEAGLALRKQKNSSIKNPLALFQFKFMKGQSDISLEKFYPLIAGELNVKKVEIVKEEQSLNAAFWQLKANVRGNDFLVALDPRINAALRYEGWARVILRNLQSLRKKRGLEFTDMARARWYSKDARIKKAIGQFGDEIRKKALLESFTLVTEEKMDKPLTMQLSDGKSKGVLWIELQ